MRNARIATVQPWLRSAASLLVLALAAALTLPAAAAPAPESPPAKKKDEPDKPRAEEDDRALDNYLQNLPIPSGMSEEQIKQMREMIKRQLKASGMALPRGLGPFAAAGAPFPATFPVFDQPEQGRLGVVAEKPSTTLAEQLDLPKDQGLVVREVVADSAAAKAGLKPHDILLELNGKPVPNEAHQLRKLLDDVKADTPVDVVVMRKGKRETVKGLTLPEAKDVKPAFPVLNFPVGPVPLQLPAFPVLPLAPGVTGVMTTTFRNGDRFTTRHQEGTLVITVTGTLADGKAKVGEIQVQDGAASHKYDGPDKVDEAYKDKVKNLIEMSEKSGVKIEIKAP